MGFRHTFRTLAVLGLAALLGSCAMPMTEADCRNADWYKLGHRDARYYGMQPQIDQLATQCGRFGVRAVEAPYMEGWRDGYGEAQRGMGGSGGGAY